MPVRHLAEPANYPAATAATVAADRFVFADSTDLNKIKQLPPTLIGGIPAANIDVSPVGAITENKVQAALAGLDTRITNLAAVGGKNGIIGNGVPAAGQGVDGDFYLNAANGDWYGPKTGGAWGASFDNAFSQLGLSNAAGAASQVAGGAGAGTLASREGHFHPHQSAAVTLLTSNHASGLYTAGQSVEAGLGAVTTALNALDTTVTTQGLQQTTDINTATTNTIEAAGLTLPSGAQKRTLSLDVDGILIVSDPF